MELKLGAPIQRRKILVVRHQLQNPAFYDPFLAWLLRYYPETGAHFYIHDLPAPIPDRQDYALMVPWLQDPVQHWSPVVYDQMCRLQELLASRGVPTLNPVDLQPRTVKSSAPAYFREAGFRAPEAKKIGDIERFRSEPTLPFPFLIREDWGHRGPMWRIETERDLKEAKIESLERPVAIEYVDVRRPYDGRYLKYRYFVCGRFGVTHHLVASDQWVTHADDRIENDQTIREELDYMRNDDPHRNRFLRAGALLGLDLLAFDYGYGPDGEVVVWEANPYPEIRFGKTSTLYRNPVRHRTCRAMLALYLERAGIPLPATLGASLSYPVTDEEHRRFAIPVDFLP